MFNISKINPDFTKPTGPLLGLLYFFVISILLVLLLFVVVNNAGSFSTYGVSKTVGWGWNIMNWLPLISSLCLLWYILAYFILLLCRATVSKVLAILNLCLVVPLFPIILFPDCSYAFTTLTLIPMLCMLVLFANIGFAIRYATTAKRKHNMIK